MKQLTVRLPDRQIELIDQLDELYGETRAAKVRTIIATFLGGAVRWRPGQIKEIDDRDVR